MKKIACILVATLFGCGVLMAQKIPAGTETGPGPYLLSFNEEPHDFGNIPQGKPVTFTFLAKNISKEDITLQSITASCGCTTPEFKVGTYKPGETFPIKVTYNAANPGSFQKTVTVIMNGGKMETLHIKGTVVPNTDASKTM